MLTTVEKEILTYASKCLRTSAVKKIQVKIPTKDDLVINLSSRKLAITAETIPQKGIQLSNNPETKQPNDICFPKRKPH